jgi:acetyltransferase-like isoleucine patch superfamily enzyme
MSSPASQPSPLKPLLIAPLRTIFRWTSRLRTLAVRLVAHAKLSAASQHALPASVVVMKPAQVHGTGNIRVGADSLLYPGVYLETEDGGEIVIGRGVVLSSGVHIAARSRVVIGDGCMIGEYASLRDANHTREPGKA